MAAIPKPVSVSLFGLLILTQVAHSLEEYAGRLYEVFPPARVVSSLFASDLQLGFVIFNALLVGFGTWCYVWPVRHHWASAKGLMWVWVGIELVNGVGHPGWSLSVHGYTPGVVTALVLLPLALALWWRLRTEPPDRVAAT